MVEDFIDMLLLGNGPSGHTTTVEQSVESHYCAFAAEESRLHNGAVVELDKFRNRQYRVTVYYKKKRRDVL